MTDIPVKTDYLPEGEEFERVIRNRKMRGRVWLAFFFAAIVIAILSLTMLLYTIVNEAFGMVAEDFRNDPDDLAELFLEVDQEFASLESDQHVEIISAFFANNTERLRLLTAEYVVDGFETEIDAAQEAQPTVVEAMIFEDIEEDIIIVYDQTGTSFADKYPSTRTLTDFLLSNLKENDRFNIIAFGGEEANRYTATYRGADDAEDAIDWLNDLEELEPVEIEARLESALQDALSIVDPDRVTVIVYLADAENLLPGEAKATIVDEFTASLPADSVTLFPAIVDTERSVLSGQGDTEALRELIATPVGELLEEGTYPEDLAEQPFGTGISSEEYALILQNNLSEEELQEFVEVEIGEGFNQNLDLLATEVLGPLPSDPKAFDDLSTEELSKIATTFFQRNEARLRVLVFDWVLGLSLPGDREAFEEAAQDRVSEVMDPGTYPDEFANRNMGDLTNPQVLQPEDYQVLLEMNLDDTQLRDLVIAEVARVEVVGSWPLDEAIFNRDDIDAAVADGGDLEGAELKWRSWVNTDFLTRPMNTRPELAGIRTAILGSLWMIGMVILFAFPLGVGAALYLEEYATKNRFNTIVQTNIYNLAGVPSIIYGILGLAVFVRAFEPLTSGSIFGVSDPTTANGRTLISASLTMSLLILPIIIINGQEAIRAVPSSLREASYGVGATKWQTIWNHVLPNAAPGIMTGTILAISRAIGETAPLLVVGAATYIISNPDGPFSKFTVLPIQIYRWTSEPEPEFRDAAAAAIVVLLVILLSLNSIAVLLRNRFRRSI